MLQNIQKLENLGVEIINIFDNLGWKCYFIRMQFLASYTSE